MANDAACAEHCRLWLAAQGLSYCATSRVAFARAHPTLCGLAYEFTLRGYLRWLARGGRADELESFAAYLSPRFERATSSACASWRCEGSPSSAACDVVTVGRSSVSWTTPSSSTIPARIFDPPSGQLGPGGSGSRRTSVVSPVLIAFAPLQT